MNEAHVIAGRSVCFAVRSLVVTVLTGLAFSAAAVERPFGGGAPAFQIIAPNGQQSVLIGVVHVSTKGLRLSDPEVLAGKRHFVLEHSGERGPDANDTGSSEVAISARPAKWASRLSGKELDIYYRRAACAGQTREQAQALLTHAEVRDANQLAYTVCGLKQRLATDVVLTVAAMLKYRLTPEYLEDDSFAQHQRLAVPEGIVERGFRWALAHDPATVLAPVAAAANGGDFDALPALVAASFASPADAAVHWTIMVDQRNAAWMPRLRHYVDDGDAVIVVGAVHLAGPGGLVARLRSEGYRVIQMRLPAMR